MASPRSGRAVFRRDFCNSAFAIFRRQFPRIQALALFVQAVKQLSIHFRSFLCFFFALYNIINQNHSCKDYFFASPYRAKAIKGEFTGPVAPYGYRKAPADKRHLIPNECAPVIRRMFRLALEGKTCCMIATILQREKVLTPQAYEMVHAGRYFSEERKNNPYACSPISVKALLSNPVYLGNMVGQRATSRSCKDKRVVFRPKDEWITVENTYEPLVDKVTFDTARERLKIKKPDWTYNPNNIFRGMRSADGVLIVGLREGRR